MHALVINCCSSMVVVTAMLKRSGGGCGVGVALEWSGGGCGFDRSGSEVSRVMLFRAKCLNRRV
jgi:hypothetical protein